MTSIIPEQDQSVLPLPVLGPHEQLDRLAALSAEQMRTALIFLFGISPDMFDLAMDAADPDEDAPGATGEAAPRCELCGADVGIFLRYGLEWRHFRGDGTTAGAQELFDPGHEPVVTWHLLEDEPATR
jgi:hypothetical protein